MGEKWVKTAFFSKVILDHWGGTNKCFEPFLARFDPF